VTRRTGRALAPSHWSNLTGPISLVPAYWRNLFPSSAQGPELSPKPNVREETGGRGNPFADGLGSLVEATQQSRK